MPLHSWMIGANSPAGSAWAPSPKTTSNKMRPTSGSAASCLIRRILRSLSIIGCNRPTMKNSSPRSMIVWAMLRSGSASAWAAVIGALE